MRIGSLNEYLNDSGVHIFNPLFFPHDLLAGSTINITGGDSERGGVQKNFLRIVTRELHPSLAIEKSHEIKQYLQLNLKGAFFDGKTVLRIQADTPEPLYLGEENGCYTVSMNYTILEG